VGGPEDASLELAEALLPALEPFLLAPQVFQPWYDRPAGLPPQWDLSLGLAILTSDQLRGWQLTLPADKGSRVQAMEGRLSAELRRWSTAVSARAAAELDQRLLLWRAYLGDLLGGDEDISAYPTQVRNRLLIDRLETVLLHPASETTVQELRSLDHRLRQSFTPGAFVLQPPLDRVYDPESFWYLYGRPHPTQASR
jgi:hypothetical protein